MIQITAKQLAQISREAKDLFQFSGEITGFLFLSFVFKFNFMYMAVLSVCMHVYMYLCVCEPYYVNLCMQCP